MGLETAIEKELNNLGVNLVDDLQESARPYRASGQLEQDIKFEVRETAKGFSFQLIMADYYDFLDKGVKGTKENRAPKSPYSYNQKQPPSIDIANWLRTKSLEGVVQGGKRTPKERLAWIIAKSIKEKGTKPTNFYTSVVNDKYLDFFRSSLIAASGKIITLELTDL